MKYLLLTALTAGSLLACAATAQAQPWGPPPPTPWGPPPAQPGPWGDDEFRERVPNLNGVWYNNGNPSVPCRIVQREPDGRALFINENGSQAWGTIRGDRVWIPEWNNGPGREGLRGRYRGDRIIWPDGNFWSR